MNKILLGTTLMVLVLSGCASKLTPAGSMTRQLPVEMVNNCKFIGSSTEYSSMKFAKTNKTEVLILAKEYTAKMGGDSFVVNAIDNDGMNHYTITFEMFKCR